MYQNDTRKAAMAAGYYYGCFDREERLRVNNEMSGIENQAPHPYCERKA
jgi:hypothetical protein